jgi:diguanylate cyclase (GGDEF)-like protein
MAVDLKGLASMCTNLRLLYVEDNPSDREITLKLLKNFFKEIVIAVDGQDGLEKFRQSYFDLVLTDVNMPNMNGLDMLEAIKKEDEEVHSIILSAHEETSHFLQAINMGINGYIVKPLDLDQFFSIVEKTVTQMNLLQLAKDYKKNLEEQVEQRNQEILYKLHYDALTALYSRYSFFRDLKEFPTPMVILVDINRFRVINEVYGNEIGSKLLEKFALYLSIAVEDDRCKIYRLSGDEFAVVGFDNKIDPEQYELLVENLLKKLSHKLLTVGEHLIRIDITLGLSSDQIHPYESAKIALDYAKKHRKPFMMYSSAIDYRKESSLTLQCRDDIALAIKNQRVHAVYQPIVDKDENIVKYETLMRIQKEGVDEKLSPASFLEIAMKTRLYEELSYIVIVSTLQKMKDCTCVLSLNLTYNDIKNIHLVEKLNNFFKEYPTVGSRVIFEITEDQAIENYDDVKQFIKKFREYKIRIAIDDFGSGFSNFEYILEIEPDYIKIDGSLVKNIDTNKKSFTLVEAIVQFSHKLGIKVIAEYVHSRHIFEMLKSLEIDEYQGFYFFKPLDSFEDNKRS